MSTTQERQIELADPAIVDAIVRQVVQRIQAMQNGKMGISEPQTSPESDSNPSRIVVTDKVVTLETLRGKLAGVKTIVVEPQSIVTPAVKDELNGLGIAIEKNNSPAKSSKPQATFCVARLSSHFVAAEWLKELGKTQICCGEDYQQLAEKLGSQYSDSKTICFAAQPFVAVSRLNRHANLRAAFGRTEKEVAEISSTLDANVLVLDTVQSRKEQLELIRFFVSQQKGVTG